LATLRRLVGPVLALSLPLAGRDLFVAPGEFVVSPGQRIAVLIEGAGTSPRLVRDAALHSPKGVYNVVNLRAEGTGIVGDATIQGRGALFLTVRTAPETVSRELFSSYAKAILVSESADDQFGRVTGLDFEIVPEGNPHRLKAGDRLPVRLLLGGEPAAGIDIEVSRAGGGRRIAGRTDAAGRAAVPIASPGVWRLMATARKRRGAGWETLSTSLTFALENP
jgi:hypothetical protein